MMRLLRPPHSGIFLRSFRLHSAHYARETITKICSLWALRCAVPAARKPGVAIHGHSRDACVAPMFFTPRKIPFQSRLLVMGLVLHEHFGLGISSRDLCYGAAGFATTPPFITNETRSTALISSSGESGTAMMSAK